MKILLSFSVFLLVLIGCSGGKNAMLNKNPALVFDNPYWIEVVPGQQDGQKSMVLFLPYSMALENYAVDSAYFRGYHVPLKKSKMQESEVYRAKIMLRDDDTPATPPFDILNNQALVSYTDKEGNRRYFIVDNIVQGESIYMP